METGRFTPYELAFAGAHLEQQAFPAALEEFEKRGLDPLNREEFVLAASVGAALQDLVPEDAPANVLDRYVDILFHAFHFWRYGRRMYCFDEAVVRYWVETRPAVSGWAARAPHPALYLQWPRNLFWATVSEGAAPEPVDGFFVVTREAEQEGRRFTEVNALMAAGLRPGRAGFGTIAFRCGLEPAGIPAEAAWMFRSELPGSDLAGIYALERLPEAVRLVEAAFWYLERYPDHARAVPGSKEAAAGPAAMKGPTALDHLAVTLSSNDSGSSAGGHGAHE